MRGRGRCAPSLRRAGPSSCAVTTVLLASISETSPARSELQNAFDVSSVECRYRTCSRGQGQHTDWLQRVPEGERTRFGLREEQHVNPPTALLRRR